jgi:hypothetical protein
MVARHPEPEGRSAGRLPLFAAAGLLACLAAACAESPPDYRVESDLGESIRSLGSDDLEESEPAADRIVAFGRDAIPALATALAREPAAVRLGVVDVLGRIDHPDALPVLMRAAARDRDVEVRATALRVLGVRAPPEAGALVEAGLADPEPSIRLAAAAACAGLCTSPAALDRLSKRPFVRVDDSRAAGQRESCAAPLPQLPPTSSSRSWTRWRRSTSSRCVSDAVPSSTPSDRLKPFRSSASSRGSRPTSRTMRSEWWAAK